MWEHMANAQVARTQNVILLEIDCTEKKIRTLQVTRYNQDGSVKKSWSGEDEWDFISPDSNGDTLQKILCK